MMDRVILGNSIEILFTRSSLIFLMGSDTMIGMFYITTQTRLMAAHPPRRWPPEECSNAEGNP